MSADGYAQAKDVLKIVVGLAAWFEGAGILLLLLAFVPQFGLQGIWISIFTAISAFCNAGFDLFGQFGAYSSLVPYVHNYYVQAVVMFMIIAGGLGFMVWVELIQYPKKRKLSLHARVVLIFSVLLWVGVRPSSACWSGTTPPAWAASACRTRSWRRCSSRCPPARPV